MKITIHTFRTNTTRATDYYRDAFEFRADLPKTPVGKVLRRELRDH